MMKLTRQVAFLCFIVTHLQCVTLVGGFQQQPLLPSTLLRLHHDQTCRSRSSSTPKLYSPRRTKAFSALPASPLSIISAIGSPLGSVGVLAFVVLFHEMGHYLAAQSLGIKVEEFSVGVGPKLFGFQAFGNEFNLRGLPLGGYVRFPENYNATQVAELQEEAMNTQIAIEDDNSKENTVLSGLMNVLTFGRLERKRAEEEEERNRLMADKKQEESSKWWSSIFSSKSSKDEEPTKVKPEKFEIEYYDDPDLLQNRPWPQRALVLSGGVIFNLLLAFLIFFGEINVGNGLPKPVFDQGAIVASIPRQESPSNGILAPGDVIVKVNGAFLY